MLVENEGFRSTPYKDSRGKKTIGIGFNIDDPTVARTIGSRASMTKPEAMDILSAILLPRAEYEAATYIGPKIFNSLNPAGQDALVDMSFNLGATTLNKFEGVRTAIQQGDANQAFNEVLDSDYAQQVPSRALRNAYMLRTGQRVTKEQAVRMFQAEQSLIPDGVIGSKTKAALKRFRRKK